MVGGPSQMDLFDYKPVMSEWYDKDLPDSVRMGQRLTTMTSGQARFPIAPSKFKFAQHGQCGHVGQRAAAVDGEDGRRHVLHPQHAHRGDQPRAGHHATCRPATRSPAGRASARGRRTASARSTRTCRRSSCWSPSRRNTEQVQAISARLWSSGYPAGRARRRVASARRAIRSCTSTTRPACRATSAARRSTACKALNELNYQQVGDPETHTRIQQYELAFRMQASVPELTDLASEPESTFELYGDAAQEARHVRQHGAAGPPAWSSAACASCRSTTTTGTRTPTSPAGCPTSAATSISRATA